MHAAMSVLECHALHEPGVVYSESQRAALPLCARAGGAADGVGGYSIEGGVVISLERGRHAMAEPERPLDTGLRCGTWSCAAC